MSPAEANLVPLFIPVGPELLIIVGILILLFGANKIPKLARATGQSISEFQRGRKGSSPDNAESQPSSESESRETSSAESAEPKR